MDKGPISKEIMVRKLREAISHVNRNLYEWSVGTKKGRIKFNISYTDVNGLVRNWLVRSFRDAIGYSDADRLFRGMYIKIDIEKEIIQSISLSSEGSWSKYYKDVVEILHSLNYTGLAYNPSDYIMDGMSERKPGFDPFVFVSFDNIKSIKF